MFRLVARTSRIRPQKMNLNLSYESIESEESLETESALENLRRGGPADSPESPDECLSSETFIVEHSAYEESVTSSRVLEYLEQVQQEDSSSFFVTPLGTPSRKSFLPVSPLNELEKRVFKDAATLPRLSTANTRQCQRLNKSGPVTARSRSGMWLSTTENRKRTWR